jgi:membrane-bound metal-dependent hydrolase YbcI (DUF457 family)
VAGFKTHITTSSLLGVVYGGGGLALGVPLSTCLLAGGLCSVSGMLPDLDSDSGIPLRESIAFSAAVVPMLMIERFEQLGLDHEQMVLAAGLIYLLIRFVIAGVFKRYTVHRGMWHSIPAAATVGLVAFMICQCEEISLRVFKSGGVVLGFMSHLVLDEIYSVEMKRGRMRLKKSFGTALKFWGNRTWANISTYGKLIAVIALAFGDQMYMASLEHLQGGAADTTQAAHRIVEQLKDAATDGQRR